MNDYLKTEARLYKVLEKMIGDNDECCLIDEIQEKNIILNVKKEKYLVLFKVISSDFSKKYSLILQGQNNLEISRISRFDLANQEYERLYILNNNSKCVRRVKIVLNKNKVEEISFIENNKNDIIQKNYDLNKEQIVKVFTPTDTYLRVGQKLILPIDDETFIYDIEKRNYSVVSFEEQNLDEVVKKISDNKRNVENLSRQLKSFNIDVEKESSKIIDKLEKRKKYLVDIIIKLAYSEKELFNLKKLDFGTDLEILACELEKKYSEFFPEKESLSKKYINKLKY